MIKKINIKDVNINKAKFHFTLINNYESISVNGLIAQKGPASQMVNEQDERVYLSEGIRGMLEMKNSFIRKFCDLRVCDIPDDYKPFFSFIDFSSEDKLTKKVVYDALIRRFNAEVYLIVDAKENEDYLIEEKISDEDIRCIRNHDIAPEKLQLLTMEKGCSALSILQYYYRMYLNEFKDRDFARKYNYSNLASFLDYYKTGVINDYNLIYYVEKAVGYNEKINQSFVKKMTPEKSYIY